MTELRLPSRLPVDVRPRQGETVDSYVDRLAAANHIEPRLLRAFLHGAYDSRARAQLDRLAAASGRSEEILHRTLAGFHCELCSAPLSASTKTSTRWCTPSCREKAYRLRNPERYRPAPKPPVENVCEACKSTFTSPRSERWCSRDCRLVVRQRAGCRRCGNPTPPDRHGLPHPWCSDACRSWGYRRRRKQRLKALKETTELKPPDLR